MQLRHQEDKKPFFSKTSVHIVTLTIIALLLRLYKLRSGEVLISSDEVFLFEYAVKPVYAFFHPSLETIATELFRFFNFGWGWGNLFFGTLFFFFYNLFGIPFTEATINLPYVFVGTGSVIIAYFLGREIHSARYGFIAAFLIAILPSHISFSRSIGVNGISGLFCFLVTLYLFVRHFKTKEEKYKLLGYLSLAYYFFSDNQAIAVIPLLLFASYVYSPHLSFLKRTFFAVRQIMSTKGILISICLSLPAVLGAIYLSTKGLALHSYFNIFHSKPIIFSFYGEYVYSSFISNIGSLYTIVLLIGFLFYLLLLIRGLVNRESLIILVWLLLYTIPWLFLVYPSSYELRVYNTYSLSALIFLTSYFICFLFSVLEKPYLFKRLNLLYSYCLIFLCILFFVHTLLITAGAVYSTSSLDDEIPVPVFGHARDNNGIKTIGYYVREHISADSVIFADVESFNAHFYFNRTVLADLDLSSEQIYRQLFSHLYPDLNSSESNVRFDYAFIQRKHVIILAPLLEQNGYRIIVIAVNNNEEEIAYLYANTREIDMDTTSLILHIKEYDKLFNDRYGTLDALYIDYG